MSGHSSRTRPVVAVRALYMRAGAKGPGMSKGLVLEVNPSGEEPTDGPKQKLKSFEIPNRLVFEAWKKVQANSGAPGVDAVSIDDFAADEVNNLYKLWNRDVLGELLPGAGASG